MTLLAYGVGFVLGAALGFLLGYTYWKRRLTAGVKEVDHQTFPGQTP